MVAGGYNSKNFVLDSVEFLDLGTSLDNISFGNLRWRNLPELKQPRSSSLILINDRCDIYVLITTLFSMIFQKICACCWWRSQKQRLGGEL